MSKTRAINFTRVGWLPVMLAAFVALLAFSPTPAGAFGTGTISGKVTGAADNPLADVCVAWFDSDGNSSGDETDSSGNYSLGFAETGDYKILFSRCGNNVNVFDEWYNDKETLAEATPVSATDGADTPDINAQLATGGSISGKVTNGSGGPHQGTCVTALGGTHGWAGEGRTDTSGNYRVGGLESGHYKIKFRRCDDGDNVISEFYPDKADLDEATTISVTAGSNTPGINAELAPGGSITGIYSIESSVAPVHCSASASVYDSSGSQVDSVNFFPGTGVHDAYRFDRLKTGDYRVGFQLDCWGELDPGLAFSSSDFYRGKGTLANATPVYVTQGSTRTGINSLSNGGASISGTVTDSSGKPLDDICVDTYDGQGNLGNFGRTDFDGGYVIDQFTAGDYRLKFSDCHNPGSAVVSEFYDDKASLAEAAPVSLTYGQNVSGIDAELDVAGSDATDPEAGSPQTTDPKAANLKIKVKGPVRVRNRKKATYRVRISNSGDARARGVKLKVKGKGVRFRATVGRISARSARTVKVKLKPKKAGKTKLRFKVTTSNAGRMSVKRRIKVRK
ncbi:MAG: carboxypeptidase regulatory-like domain-containing protein [Solirubrobacterales bacterium]|nr:carboxypeptidase regulatory-like domain-containing protein [Solirubrobacterales bacterium]